MEHRAGERVAASLNVSVWVADDHLGWFRTINLSQGGLAIRGQLWGLKTNALVRIVLEILDHPVPRLVTLRALVVHQSSEATGLMWATDETVLVGLLPIAEQRAA